MPPKRKWNQPDNEGEDVPLGNQVLPVANLPGDFNGEPEDGFQYLFLVRRDARSLPNTTRVMNPYEAFAAASAPVIRKPPHPCIPSEEWRTSFEATFRAFRQAWRTGQANASPKAVSKLPRAKDREGWLHYINGTTTSQEKAVSYPPSTAFTPRSVGARRNPGSQSQSNVSGGASNIQSAGIIDEEDPETYAEDVKIETPTIEPRKPIPSIIKSMNDHSAIHLLMFIAHWIRKSLDGASTPALSPMSIRPFHFPRHHQQWAFSLLAQLDASLRSEEISHLRETARACIAAIRQDLDSDGPVEVEVDSGVSISTLRDGQNGSVPLEQVDHSSRYAHLIGTWMIVGAIASIWGQRDMWQDAEEALADLVVVKPRRLAPKPPKTTAATNIQIKPKLDRPDPEVDLVLNYG